MYHSRWKGAGYEAGFRYGSILGKNGIDPLASVRNMMDLNGKRAEFGRACLPVYNKICPEIVSEIEGICDGLGGSRAEMESFLFSMYCYLPVGNCSCFAVSRDGKAVFGRNSDFAVNVEKLCDSAFYRPEKGYSFIGNTTAWTEMEDGINERGLAAGLTLVWPVKFRPGLNAGMLLRLILERCGTVREALNFLKTVPVASAQTITLADGGGNIASVECNCDRIIELPVRVSSCGCLYVFSANHFVSGEMSEYVYDGPDDVHSHERWNTMSASLAEAEASAGYARKLLSGEYGFMCRYDRKKGMDTIWSSVYETDPVKILRAEGNPSRKPYKEDTRMSGADRRP